PTKFKIFDIRKVPSAEPARVGKYDQLVMYELDPMRRYIVRIPEEEFTEDLMIQKIKEDMEERGKFTGREFEIP
ncbi:unnamed protein product, partial [marine sediment metagenome]